MSGHQRRRATPKIIHNPHQPEGWRRDGADFFVAPTLRCTGISRRRRARELDAVALATNVTVLMERGTKVPGVGVEPSRGIPSQDFKSCGWDFSVAVQSAEIPALRNVYVA